MKEKKFDVCALGELLIDFTENGVSPQGNPLMEVNPGGAPCNVLAMLCKQGYKSCVRSWEENWDILSTFFAYPAEVRKIIYTTNIIEGLNRQFRKITKNKPSFTNDDSLRKILYLASKNIVSHWSVTCWNWDVVSNQLSIMFADRKSA